jgi:photosystem II stability/assembly factor-like uncharacterized protein
MQSRNGNDLYMSTHQPRSERRRRASASGGSNTIRQIIIGAGAGLVLVAIIAIIVVFTGNDSAEAALEPVDSIDYAFGSNHLHGLGHDHENDRVLLASHFGLFAIEDDQLYQVGDIRDDLMGFTMNPHDPSELYVSGHPIDGGNLGVKHSTDGGLTFTHIFNGVGDEVVDFHSMTLSAANTDRIYGAFQGYLYRTEDGGENWVAFQPEGLPDPGLCWGVPCLATDSDNADVLYAGTANGLMRSDDSGESWQTINSDIGQTAAVKVDPRNAERIYAYTEALGMALSTDAGQTWQPIHGNLPEVGSIGVFYAIALDMNDEQRLFAANIDNHVYETTDGGNTWERII